MTTTQSPTMQPNVRTLRSSCLALDFDEARQKTALAIANIIGRGKMVESWVRKGFTHYRSTAHVIDPHSLKSSDCEVEQFWVPAQVHVFLFGIDKEESHGLLRSPKIYHDVLRKVWTRQERACCVNGLVFVAQS